MTELATETQARKEIEREINSAHVDPRTLETSSRSFLKEVRQHPARLETYRKALAEAIKGHPLINVSSVENAAYLAVNLASPEGLRNLVEHAQDREGDGSNDEVVSISIGAIRSFPDNAVRQQFKPQLIRWLRSPSASVGNHAFTALCSINITHATEYLLIFVSFHRNNEEAIKQALADIYFLGGETERGETIIKSAIDIVPSLTELVISNRYLPPVLRNRIEKPKITGFAQGGFRKLLYDRILRRFRKTTLPTSNNMDFDRIGAMLKSIAILLENDRFLSFHEIISTLGEEYAGIFSDPETWAIVMLEQARKNRWPHETSGCLPRGFAVIDRQPNNISKVLVAHCYFPFTFGFARTLNQSASDSEETVYELVLSSEKAGYLNEIFRHADKLRLDNLSQSYSGFIGEVEHVLRSLKENKPLDITTSAANFRSETVTQIASEQEESYAEGLKSTREQAIAIKKPRSASGR